MTIIAQSAMRNARFPIRLIRLMLADNIFVPPVVSLHFRDCAILFLPITCFMLLHCNKHSFCWSNISGG